MSEPVSLRKRKLAAILMADVSGYSALMGRDEDRTTSRIREFHERVAGLVREHEGRVVDTAGDSVFGEFPSVVNAVTCAQAIQDRQLEVENEVADDPIRTRIGVHLGDVIAEGERVYGDGVNIAARLEALAEPGGICVSEAVYQQVRNKLELDFEDAGEQRLKNIEHPVRLFKLAPRALVPVVVDATASNVGAARAQPIRVRTVAPPPQGEGYLAEHLLAPGTFVPLVAAGLLGVSPLLGFPSWGTLPGLGAILAGAVLGRLWGRRTGRRGVTAIGLGLGLALAAPLTDWSSETNGLLLVAGALCAAFGLSRPFRRAPGSRAKPSPKRRRRRPARSRSE